MSEQEQTFSEQPLREAVEKLRLMMCLPAYVEHMLDEALKQTPVLEIVGYEGSSGLYYSRLSAVANGEQSIEPVYRVKKL